MGEILKIAEEIEKKYSKIEKEKRLAKIREKKERQKMYSLN
jgi:hypothetical protein